MNGESALTTSHALERGSGSDLARAVGSSAQRRTACGSRSSSAAKIDKGDVSRLPWPTAQSFTSIVDNLESSEIGNSSPKGAHHFTDLPGCVSFENVRN